MRASLVSREVIADSIELMVHAHDFDALVCLVGCDKTVPAALMALARVDRPAVVLSGGPDARRPPARPRGDDPGRLGGGRRPRARAHLARRARRAGARRVPRARATAPATSPRTRWPSPSTCSASGSIGDGLIPAAYAEEKDAAAERAGTLAVSLARARRSRARRFLDRRALENAPPGVVASGGSTNGFLHLLAIAREAGVELTLDDLAAISARTPVMADLVPGGALGRRGPAPRGRHGDAHPRAHPRRPRRRERADGRRPHARRGDRGCAEPRRRDHRVVQAARLAATRCAATSRPTAPW